MPRLHLLRHAKSSWDSPGLDDHDRPLAPRGSRATGLLCEHLAESGAAPDLVLCSSALRTVQTLEGIREALPEQAAVEVSDDLYGADADTLLGRLQEIADRTGEVMLIAHNPGIGTLADSLAGRGDAETRGRMAEKYPTGGLATLGFEGAWRELDWGSATLIAFVVPRELG